MSLRLRLALRVTAVATALVAVAGCSGRGAVKQDVVGSDGYQRGNASLQYVTVSHRRTPGHITGKLLDGRPFDLASWRGKVVVVNFWGSWCAECHDEADALQQVHADTQAQGVEFLGVDVRDDIASGRNYERRYHVTYPSLDDPSNAVALRFLSAGMPPNATPTTLVLDRNGRVAARWSGSILYRQLTDLVARVTAERA
jgi:peroxiredoxin